MSKKVYAKRDFRKTREKKSRAAKLEELYSSFGFRSLHENAGACQQRDFKPLSFLPAVEFTITSTI